LREVLQTSRIDAEVVEHNVTPTDWRLSGVSWVPPTVRINRVDLDPDSACRDHEFTAREKLRTKGPIALQP
jgi:hypothetical protein